MAVNRLKQFTKVEYVRGLCRLSNDREDRSKNTGLAPIVVDRRDQRRFPQTRIFMCLQKQARLPTSFFLPAACTARRSHLIEDGVIALPVQRILSELLDSV